MPTEKKVDLSFTEKMIELQKNIEPIKKGKVNPHFKSKYADINGLLEAIKPELNELGLLLIQPITIRDGHMVLETKIYDALGMIEAEMILPEIGDPQKMGAVITYYRRYSLQSLLGLQAEDDDGNDASKAVKETPKKNYSGENMVYEEVNKNMEDDGVPCTECATLFIPKFPGAKLCLNCYKKSK